VHGLQWQRHLTKWSARHSQLQLLQWLYECGCPWDKKEVCTNAAGSGNVAMLVWLQQETAPWTAELKREMLFEAGWKDKWDAVQWLRQQGAGWPLRFVGAPMTWGVEKQVCWTANVVIRALNNGCSWGEWQCSQLLPELYTTNFCKSNAEQLFKWAHSNGCPCTCAADTS
jgi:hypothetical protein